MQNIGPKKKAGRKPKQKNALAKANAERRAASLKKITENKLLLPSVAPAKPPIPGSEKSPPCSPRPPINETEVDNVMQSTQAAPLSPDSSLCTPQPGTEPKSIKSTGRSKNPPPCSSRPPTNETEVDNVMQSTQAAPLSPDFSLCTPQPGTQPKPIKSTGLNKTPKQKGIQGFFPLFSGSNPQELPNNTPGAVENPPFTPQARAAPDATESGGLSRGRKKGDPRNTGRQASRSREAQIAAEGALFVEKSPATPKEAPFTPDTTGMCPRPDSHAKWPSTGAPQPRPEERRAQAQLQEAEEYFKDAEEVLGAATHVANQALQWGQCAASDCGCGQKPVSQSKLLDHMSTYKPAAPTSRQGTHQPRRQGTHQGHEIKAPTKAPVHLCALFAPRNFRGRTGSSASGAIGITQ